MSWLVGPAGLSTTRTPSTKPVPLALAHAFVEQTLDRRAHALGEAADEHVIVRRFEPVAVEAHRFAEDDSPFGRGRKQTERPERGERRRDRDVGKAERLRDAF